MSFVLPVRNEATHITSTLQALSEQTYDKRFYEIIVADGLSEDGTKDIAEQFAIGHPDLRLTIVDNPGRIYSTGFNLGIQLACGDALIFTGGHTRFSSNYLAECSHYLQNTDAACVGGLTFTTGLNEGAKAIALALGSRFGLGGAEFRVSRNIEPREVETVAYGAYRRAVFDRIGSLDEELVRNQDDEYNYRLRRAGGRILLIPTISAQYHSPRSDLRQLWKQYFGFGYWKVRVLQKHPLQMSPRQFVPPAFVATLVGGLLLGLVFRPILWIWLAVIALYMVVSLAVSASIAARTRWHYFPRLPLIFATLHIGYGLGFLKGLIVFVRRWRDRGLLSLPWETTS